MRIVLAADHRGFRLKEMVKDALTRRGVTVEDLGTHSEESTDYPDSALAAARAIASKLADFAILVCGSGNGMAMAANKVKGIRAALALNPEMAHLARAHNDANVLALSGMFTPPEMVDNILDEFLNTPFEGGRHQRRVHKIESFEQGSK